MGMNKNWMGVIGSVVMLTICFVLFPIVLDGTASITGHTHHATFTGLDDVAAIGPLVLFVTLLFGSVFAGITGVRGLTGKGGGFGSGSLTSGGSMKVIIGLVMISITFFIFPIVMDGCVTILTDTNIATYTGLDDLVQVTPLILYVGLLFGGAAMIASGTGAIRKTRSYASKAKARYYG